MELDDKICLITGGTRGIGAATALALARGGADISLVARHPGAESEHVCHQIQELGRRAAFIAADVARPDEATRCVEQTAALLGGVDVLIHAAGGPVNGGLLDLTAEAWDEAFAVHVHAIFHLCRAAVPAMRQRKNGCIVLVSSAAGLRGLKKNLAYQTVKGALPQFARAMACEFADDNIRVNCVAPGIIRTAFHASMTPEIQRHNIANRIPLHREGTPAQVASLIRELVSNDYVTGETFAIDGGLTMRIA
ncbi:MAG TPA: SDR family oxidoreductase [Verrucomicrobiae bacterium]|nr:SDR family oxidoreductase [Verrucomicrobiae bacterium]